MRDGGPPRPAVVEDVGGPADADERGHAAGLLLDRVVAAGAGDVGPGELRPVTAAGPDVGGQQAPGADADDGEPLGVDAVPARAAAEEPDGPVDVGDGLLRVEDGHGAVAHGEHDVSLSLKINVKP